MLRQNRCLKYENSKESNKLGEVPQSLSFPCNIMSPNSTALCEYELNTAKIKQHMHTHTCISTHCLEK